MLVLSVLACRCALCRAVKALRRNLDRCVSQADFHQGGQAVVPLELKAEFSLESGAGHSNHQTAYAGERNKPRNQAQTAAALSSPAASASQASVSSKEPVLLRKSNSQALISTSQPMAGQNTQKNGLLSCFLFCQSVHPMGEPCGIRAETRKQHVWQMRR